MTRSGRDTFPLEELKVHIFSRVLLLRPPGFMANSASGTGYDGFIALVPVVRTVFAFS